MLNISSIFILRFIKISLLCGYYTTERVHREWKEAQRQGEDRVTLRITLINKYKDWGRRENLKRTRASNVDGQDLTVYPPKSRGNKFATYLLTLIVSKNTNSFFLFFSLFFFPSFFSTSEKRFYLLTTHKCCIV